MENQNNQVNSEKNPFEGKSAIRFETYKDVFDRDDENEADEESENSQEENDHGKYHSGL